MHPQKILSRPVSPQTDSRILVACMAIISHKQILKWVASHEAVSMFRIASVPTRRPTVVIVENRLT